MSTLIDHAEELCAYLNSNILGDELRLTHLLDALASCGLTLTEDPSGETSIAYLSMILGEAGLGQLSNEERGRAAP